MVVITACSYDGVPLYHGNTECVIQRPVQTFVTLFGPACWEVRLNNGLGVVASCWMLIVTNIARACTRPNSPQNEAIQNSDNPEAPKSNMQLHSVE